MTEPTPPERRRKDEDDLPTLELEITRLKAQVSEVERRVAWLEDSIRVQARGRAPKEPPHGDPPHAP